MRTTYLKQLASAVRTKLNVYLCSVFSREQTMFSMFQLLSRTLQHQYQRKRECGSSSRLTLCCFWGKLVGFLLVLQRLVVTGLDLDRQTHGERPFLSNVNCDLTIIPLQFTHMTVKSLVCKVGELAYNYYNNMSE
eukprot:Gb_32964 [translate_table: standard]